MNKLSWIIDRFEDFKDQPALVGESYCYTYSKLSLEIESWRKIINAFGILKGQSIALVSDCSPNAIFLFVALLLNGNIVVPLSSEVRERFDQLFKIANVQICFEFTKNNNWIYTQIKNDNEHALLTELRSNNESGIIIFSSGTTGEPKAAVHQTSRLLKKKKNNKKKSLRTLIFLKMDHIGGVNTIFSILLNGGTLISTKARTPRAVCEAVERHGVQLLPTTPTFLNMLIMSGLHQNYDLSSLQIISYGTEPMSDSTLKAMNRILPDVKMKQTYGLTELGIFSTKSKGSNSRWMKVGGKDAKIKIVDNILWVKAESAMLGYLNASWPFDEDGWYNTGDYVERDGDYLKILCREEDIINVGGEKVYPSEVESILQKMSNIREVTVGKKQNPVTGETVYALINTDKPECVNALRKRIHNYCREKLERFKIPTYIVVSEKSLVSNRYKKIRSLNSL